MATPSDADGRTLLAGFGCVLAAVLLYAMATMLWDVGGEDGFDVDERPAMGATLRR